jgi:hypothetical protein
MRREFGKRTAARSQRDQPTNVPLPARAKPPIVYSDHMPKAILAIVLTIAVVGGMFLVPKMGQCAGRRGALGLDWCQLMRASLDGAVRGVAAGRGAIAAGRH